MAHGLAQVQLPINKGAKKEKKAHVKPGIFPIIVEGETAIGGKAYGCIAAINTPNRRAACAVEFLKIMDVGITAFDYPGC